jgi:hypothetical protein
VELIRLENLPESEKEHPRSIASIRRANTSDINEKSYISDSDAGTIDYHATSIASLFPDELNASIVHLICSWRAILGQEVVRGEHHLRGVSVRPLTFFNGCPIAATVSHPPTVSHDFSKGPALVPMKVALRNRMLETPVEFNVSLEPSSNFDLIGTKMHSFTLDPSAETLLPLKALIQRAGIYDLQALELTVRQHHEEVTYQLSQQWLVSVEDASSRGSSAT